MPVYRINSALVLFVHIPKCGGTSLEAMIRAHPAFEAEVMYEMGPENLFLAVGRCSPQHWHGQLLRKLLRLDRFDLIFTVMRDPLGRIVSEHAMRCGRDPATNPDISRWYDAARQCFQEDPFYLDNHLRPAKAFLLRRARIYTLTAGLEEVWRDLCGLLGIDPALSPVQHIRPCEGPRQQAADLPLDLQQRILEDYADDVAIQAVLDARWQQQGLCWTPARALD